MWSSDRHTKGRRETSRSFSSSWCWCDRSRFVARQLDLSDRNDQTYQEVSSTYSSNCRQCRHSRSSEEFNRSGCRCSASGHGKWIYLHHSRSHGSRTSTSNSSSQSRRICPSLWCAGNCGRRHLLCRTYRQSTDARRQLRDDGLAARWYPWSTRRVLLSRWCTPEKM